ncbi:hypothetical protein Rs2_47132 [Raphanus sativus]|nr:hypothetical protein Rs2_47132 [Raphanus sativus]
MGKQASPKTSSSSVTKPVDVRGKENQIKESPEKRLVGRRSRQSAGECVSGSSSEDKSANRVSEDLLKCLLSIILRISSSQDTVLDAYSNCSEWRARELGAYKNLVSVDASSIDLGRRSNASLLINRLKFLLNKLSVVNLDGLSHQQKLAFWINTYNSCILGAWDPWTPEMVVALMQKATIIVGGHSLNAITIEHFILRLPYHLKFGLHSSNVGRARSSKERLSSSICWDIKEEQTNAPKLPDELREEALKCMERKNKESLMELVQVVPYDFSFRLLLLHQ